MSINKGGRPSHAPTDKTRKQVKFMVACGIPQDQIAKVVGITKPTLEKHYRAEIDSAEGEINGKVADSLYRKATGSGPQSVTAAIFWLKTRAGWKETTVHENVGKDGAAEIRHIVRTIIDPDDPDA